LAAGYGVTVALLGLLIGGGDPFRALVVMIVIGILLRIGAYLLIRRGQLERPPWWKWL
jgi:hypothetical protein